MSTPASASAGARPVAVAPVVFQAAKKIVDDPNLGRDVKKAMVESIYRMANGTAASRESGLPEGPDWECTGNQGATVAFRERLTADGRNIPEVVGLAEDDVTAGRQAAELLDRAPGTKLPGYPDRPQATNTVDDRTTVLDNQKVQDGLSTGSPTQRTADGAAVAKPQTGRQQPQQDQTRTR